MPTLSWFILLSTVICHSGYSQTAQLQQPATLIAPGARVTKLAGGFKFTEGPARDKPGNIYFSDIPNARIHRWSTDGQLSIFREQSGNSNGLFFDSDQNLICCEGGARRVTSVSSDGKVTVLVDAIDGKRFNSPNDLWIDSGGGIYFTDPRYGAANDLELDGFHVYYVSPDRSRVQRIIDDLSRPNGIIGTADGQLLYVADERGNKTYVYEIGEAGNLANRRLFVAQGSDGMTIDEWGNVYLTRDHVTVYSAEGEQLETIRVPETPANVTFGGADRRTLFMTARTSFYSVRMNVRGQ